MNEIMRTILWLPEQASTFAKAVDELHYFVITVTMLSSVAVGLLAFGFFFKYRQLRPRQSTPIVIPSVKFELAVVVVPLAFFLAWFVQGYRDYVWYTTPPKDTMDVYVMGKKWMWKFAYPDGPNAVGTLHVPAHRPVRLLLTSRDVIHSFFVPDFRIKMDVLPGRYTETWFEATKPGRYQILCAEYCGTWHSQMWGEVVVMPPAEFDSWMLQQRSGVGLTDRVDTATDDGPSFHGTLVEYGKRVAMAQGCLKCHSLDGDPHIGPTWLDLYRRTETLETGETVLADEAYLTDSMIDPRAKIVKGFKPVMPTYRGKLAAPDAAALVEFIKSLRSQNLDNLPSKEAIYEPARR
ncbi:MAG: cytochrome c oxidase subunit II [Myxococcales bacterium]